MIEIFKTNVLFREDSERIVLLLISEFNFVNVNFDLEDCDRILRIDNNEGSINVLAVTGLLKKEGFVCEHIPE